MWILKWLLATIILRRNIFEEAFEAIIFRTSRSTATETFTRFDVIWKNLRVMYKKPILLGFIAVLLFCLKHLVSNIKRTKVPSKLFIQRTGCFGIVALLPFAWYIVLGNHSFIHYWFTFRIVSVTILAFFSYLLICCDDFADN